MGSGRFLCSCGGIYSGFMTTGNAGGSEAEVPARRAQQGEQAPQTGDLVRLRFDIAYDGTDFHGWARQRPAHGAELRTVQGEIEDALRLILRYPVELTVAGRTDAGVHAAGQVAHADIPAASLDQRSIEGDPGRLVRRLAKMLEPDIRVSAANFAPGGFDARFSALTRTYRYRVTTAGGGALPTRVRDTAVWPKKVELEPMRAFADEVVGLHDFAAFCKARPFSTTIRDIKSFQWRDVSTEEEPELYEAIIVADAFCWNMVRALVATSLDVGSGKRAIDWATGLLDEDERAASVRLAPACGLTLIGVDYPADGELAARAAHTAQRRDASEVHSYSGRATE